jgi:hypothetical protein
MRGKHSTVGKRHGYGVSRIGAPLPWPCPTCCHSRRLGAKDRAGLLLHHLPRVCAPRVGAWHRRPHRLQRWRQQCGDAGGHAVVKGDGVDQVCGVEGGDTAGHRRCRRRGRGRYAWWHGRRRRACWHGCHCGWCCCCCCGCRRRGGGGAARLRSCLGRGLRGGLLRAAALLDLPRLLQHLCGSDGQRPEPCKQAWAAARPSGVLGIGLRAVTHLWGKVGIGLPATQANPEKLCKLRSPPPLPQSTCSRCRRHPPACLPHLPRYRSPPGWCRGPTAT